MRCCKSGCRSVLLLIFFLGCFGHTGLPAAAETLRQKLFAVPSYPNGSAEEPELKPLGEEVPDWKARLELSRLLSYTGRYGEAITSYRQVLSEKPELTEARIELGRVLYWNNNKTEALQILEQVPAEELDDGTRIVVGDLFAFQKQYDRSVAQYRQVLKTKPERTDVRFRLAEVYTWSEQYDLALKAYRDVLQADPDNIQARRKYALVLSWTGEREEAIRQLKMTLP